MIRARMLFAACVLLVGLLAAGTVGARQLRVADTHPADYPTVQALSHMGRLIAERSNGRYTLKVFHSRQLGEEEETIAQTAAGALDMARVNLTPFNAIVPETVVPSLPFLFDSVEHMHRVMDGPVGDDILHAFERHGFVGLAYYDSGARSFYSQRWPVRLPEDMAGMRIRVQQSPLAEAMVRALGAEPVPLPYGQVMAGLSSGVIDGAENNWPSFVAAGHANAARYYSLTEHVMAPEVLVVSKKVWASLPAADRDMIRAAARDSVVLMRQLWSKAEADSREAARRAGIEVNTLDKTPFVEAMRPVYDRFVTTPRLRDLVRRAQALR